MVLRDGAPREIRIPAGDRSGFLKKPRLLWPPNPPGGGLW
jgi:hypothetical protein